MNAPRLFDQWDVSVTRSHKRLILASSLRLGEVFLGSSPHFAYQDREPTWVLE